MAITPIIVVDGNIGSGKTSLMNVLEKYFIPEQIGFLYEPVQSWKCIQSPSSSTTYNLLDMFYKDPLRWSCTFQIEVTVSKAKMYEETIRQHPEVKVWFGERAFISDRDIFVQTLHEQGSMTEIDYLIYQRWYDWLSTKVPPIYAYIYLQTNPEMCYQRLTKRMRKEETSIEKSYLQALHEKYEHLFCDTPAHIITIDGNREFENNDSEQHIILGRLLKSVPTLWNVLRPEKKQAFIMNNTIMNTNTIKNNMNTIDTKKNEQNEEEPIDDDNGWKTVQRRKHIRSRKSLQRTKK